MPKRSRRQRRRAKVDNTKPHWVEVSASREQQCHLLALPAELRNAIYDYTFADTARLEYGAVVDPEYEHRFTAYGLVLANRQIYGETTEMYQQLHILTFATFAAAKEGYNNISDDRRAMITCIQFNSVPLADCRWMVSDQWFSRVYSPPKPEWEEAFEGFVRVGVWSWGVGDSLWEMHRFKICRSARNVWHVKMYETRSGAFI